MLNFLMQLLRMLSPPFLFLFKSWFPCVYPEFLVKGQEYNYR
jgi:hypothetical protein